jgi:serine/threonine protein kinase/tetratricopeptide (TPR) repeat protein
MSARTISHYQILGEIGSGGMGIVCKAEDVRLGRTVAIKFIPSARTRDEAAKQRFIQEARAASALDHPNLCTIHEIDETDDGELFLVMAYYDGETLEAKLRHGPLPPARAIDIARQVALGLGRAHEHGIAHRDVKPANIMITARGEVKVLDFGLAKLAGQRPLTEPGVPAGTVEYMAPEQIAGGTVDYRADIWALGVVLHEMITGRRVFGGRTFAAAMHAILFDPIPPVGAYCDVPEGLDAVLMRALARDVGSRYQDIERFRRDLQLLAPPSSGSTAATAWAPALPSEPSIVVLPFSNLSPPDGGEFFSDGLTEEIITDLSKTPGLRVISRPSAMQLKGASAGLRVLAADLGVQFVLEGTVRRRGSDLRITAKLVEAATGALEWADKYAGRSEDVFGIQETLSRTIVDALAPRLSGRHDRRPTGRPLDDFQAYDSYLRARFEFPRYDEQGLDRACHSLERAIDRVGENVLLVAALGAIHWQYVNAGISTDPVHLEEAARRADRVLELDPHSPHGHRLLGLVRLRQGNIEEGTRLLKRALEYDPADTEALGYLCMSYGFAGKPYVAVPLSNRLLEIDPLTPINHSVPGTLALMAGDFERAAVSLAKSHRMDPGNPIVALTYAQALALSGDTAGALKTFAMLAREASGTFLGRLARLYTHALEGARDEALACLDEPLTTAARADLYHSWNVAECLAAVGERRAAVGWIANAASRGFINYPLLSSLDPLLEGARGDPEFDAVLADIKRRWLAFAE